MFMRNRSRHMQKSSIFSWYFLWQSFVTVVFWRPTSLFVSFWWLANILSTMEFVAACKKVDYSAWAMCTDSSYSHSVHCEFKLIPSCRIQYNADCNDNYDTNTAVLTKHFEGDEWKYPKTKQCKCKLIAMLVITHIHARVMCESILTPSNANANWLLCKL